VRHTVLAFSVSSHSCPCCINAAQNNLIYPLFCRSHEEVEDDEVFVSQEGVHRAVGAEIVNNVLNGVSASCFAYGHTGEESVS
jgi:hypothetical protein